VDVEWFDYGGSVSLLLEDITDTNVQGGIY